MSVAEELRRRIEQELAPERVDVIDESARHKGHVGARPEGETHFRVVVVARAFDGKGPLERHRMVMRAAGDLMSAPIHALAIVARTPGELHPPGQ